MDGFPDASKRESLNRVTRLGACVPWHLHATDGIVLKGTMAVLLRGSAVLQEGMLEPPWNIYLTDLVCVCLCLLSMQSGRLRELTL